MNNLSFCFTLFFTLVFGLFSNTALANLDFTDPSFYKKERELYKKALVQLQDNNFGQFETYRSQLKHYPLITYLDYEYLRRSFGSANPDVIDAFINNNKGQLPARRLHIEWLGFLAKTHQWTLYERFYTSDLGSEVLDCFHLEAQLVINTDDRNTYEKIGEFWIKPGMIHSACDDVFASWSKKGLKSQNNIWRRYQLALLANNRALYPSLEKALSKEHLNLASKIKNVKNNSDYWVAVLSKDHESLALENTTKKYLINSITNIDYKKSARVFEKKHITLDTLDLHETQRLVAWYFAQKESGTAAVNWIRKHTDFRDPSFVEPMLRHALTDKNWALYKKVFTALPAMLKNQEEWLFWYAVTQEQLKYEDKDPALTPKTIYKKLAEEQSFYGLISAEKMNLPVFPHTQFEPQKPNISDDVKKRLSPTIELSYLQDENLAVADWGFTTNSFNEDEWRQAGIVAYKMGWLNRTISAFGKAKLWTAAAERFPIFYQQDFWKNAKKHDIDPGWILAVARQESAFAAQARSSVGALGVLQLMPNTAKQVAKKLGVHYQQHKLTDPSYNILLGTKYLKDQLNNYDNNYYLATAAYNAGPGKVREWLNQRPINDDWVHWVAVIPYKETRSYVQNITVFSKIYNMKLAHSSNKIVKDGE